MRSQQNDERKKKKRGRPTKFSPNILRRICFLIARGFTDKEAAFGVGIAESTLNLWKKYPYFSESIKKAKAPANEMVERSLYKRAMGVTTHEKIEIRDADGNLIQTITKEKEVLPNVRAVIFWLTNRLPHEWQLLGKLYAKQMAVQFQEEAPPESNPTIKEKYETRARKLYECLEQGLSEGDKAKGCLP